MRSIGFTTVGLAMAMVLVACEGKDSSSSVAAAGAGGAGESVPELTLQTYVETVHKLPVAKVAGRGCGTHLNAEQQSALAAEVLPLVQETMGW